ncbi:Rhodanese-like protein [Sulfitobacter noctilucicola]|uniref:Rhodanese-related sulfurtransferase n=2 Tax=Sulfitobacter noctilucicola TaxID=1342301 RepID=A0A7W6Q3Y8_9RHOB|nr:Rhodanese-like protein [Sulfitobacter noctilucicola]MBB4173604.1 rhodanese-related sulfurtransferase [Sulfitobacter noctilucicola]
MRRGILVGGAATLASGLLAGAQWFNIAGEIAEGDLSAPDAAQAAAAGDVILIDIRRPDEWARTGIGIDAVPIDMRVADFTDRLLEVTQGRTDFPVALICARGVRSAKLALQLEAAGFSKVIDVPEGMLGSGAGPGWIKRGLPVNRDVPFAEG